MLLFGFRGYDNLVHSFLHFSYHKDNAKFVQTNMSKNSLFTLMGAGGSIFSLANHNRVRPFSSVYIIGNQVLVISSAIRCPICGYGTGGRGSEGWPYRASRRLD